MPKLIDHQTTQDAICERLAEGLSLVEICRQKDMPGLTTVYRWLEENQGFRDSYTRARSLQAETMADMVVDEVMNPATGADPAMIRVRVEALKWRTGMLKPAKYGSAQLLKRRAERDFENEMIDITPDKDVDSDMPQLDRKQLARVVWHMLKSKQQEAE